MNQNQELIEAVKACLPDLEHYAVNHKDGPDERLARLKAVLSDQLPDLKLNPNCDAAKAERDEMLDVLAAMHSVHRGFSSNDNWTILDDDARAATEALLDKHGR